VRRRDSSHCAIWMFLSFTRRPHFPMSPARTARISSLAPLLISMLSASSLALTSGAASACLMSASILPTIDFGVPAGANAPIQVATSALDEWSAHLLAAAEVRRPVGKVLPFSLAGSGEM
jgi:hypothetical protein